MARSHTSTTTPVTPAVDDTVTSAAEALSDAPSDAFGVSEGGRYRVVDEVGRGGLGRVLKAIDTRLNRVVALKELLPGRNRQRGEQRFQREVLLAAKLQHPGIVPIYEAGRFESGSPFIAMRFVDGRTLKEEMAAASTFDGRMRLLNHIVVCTDAVAFAHAQGVMHRDLKPSNVLVGEFGETVVVDWGLAKVIGLSGESDTHVHVDGAPVDDDDEAAVTLDGAVLGTPAYMPPEQARGEDVDPRADVYSLGAMLYHLVTGRFPYEGTPKETLRRLSEGPPPSVLDVEKRVPRDLAHIIERAMSRSREDRYVDAGAMALELRRFHAGQLVASYDYTPWQRMTRFVRSNRASVFIATALTLLLATTIVVAVDRVVEQRDLAEARARNLTLVQAKTSLARDPTAAMAWLKTFPMDDATPAELSRIRRTAADALSRGVARHVVDFRTKVEAVTVAPGGNTAVVSLDQGVVLFDLEHGQVLTTLADPDPLETHFARDGARIITRSRRGSLSVLPGIRADGSVVDSATFPPRVFLGDKSWTSDHAVSADGTHAVIASQDGAVRLFDLDANDGDRGRILYQMPTRTLGVALNRDASLVAVTGPNEAMLIRTGTGDVVELDLNGAQHPEYIDFSPDENFVYVAHSDGTLQQFAVGAVATPPVTLLSTGVRIDVLKQSVDGARISVGLHDGRVIVVDTSNNAPRELRGHTDEILSVGFNKKANRLISGGLDRVVRIFNVDTAISKPLFGHHGIIEMVAFSTGGATEDGRRAVSGGQDETVRVWDLDAPTRVRMPGHTEDINVVMFSPDGRIVLTGCEDKSVGVWNREGARVATLLGPTHQVYSLAMSDDGSMVVAGGYFNDFYLWDVDDKGQPQDERGRLLVGHEGPVWGMKFVDDDKKILTVSNDGGVREFDVATGANRLLHRHTSDAREMAVSPDQTWVASGGGDHILRVTNRKTGHTFSHEGHTGLIHRVVFFPDGKHVATASWDKTVRIWDVDDWSSTVIRGHDGRVRALKISNDGRFVLTGSQDKTARLYDVTTGLQREVARHAAYVRELAISPDSKLGASVGWDESVQVFHLPTGRLVGFERHEDVVMRVAFSPDANFSTRSGTLAQVGYEKTLDLTPLSDLIRLPLEQEKLRTLLNEATTARIVDDATSSAFGSPRTWSTAFKMDKTDASPR